MKTLSLACFLLIFQLTYLTGQRIQNEVLTSSGGSFSNGINSIDWTLGEVSILSFGEKPKIAQGFHQVFVESIATSSQSEIEISPFKVYPNPTSDWIQFQGNWNSGGVNVKILDSSGRLMISKVLDSFNEKVSLAALPNGIYLLKVETGEMNSIYKVVKTSN